MNSSHNVAWSDPKLVDREFVNNNFDSKDFSSVISGYEEDVDASAYLDFNKVIGEMLLDLRENDKITAAATCIVQ